MTMACSRETYSAIRLFDLIDAARFSLVIPVILLLLNSQPISSCMPKKDVVTYNEPDGSGGGGSTTSAPSTTTNVPLSFGPCGHTQYVNNGEDPAAGNATTGSTAGAGGFASIVGGVVAQQNEFPWQAFLSIYNETEQSNYLCGGSLISTEWVITAAHCCKLAATAGNIVVSLGGTILTSTFPVRKTASRFVMHPNYDSFTHNNDACLIQVPKITITSWEVQPICLPRSCNAACQSGEYAIVTGWGLTNPDANSQLSTILQRAAVPIQPAINCLAKYNTFTDNMICAGFPQGGIDACQGDSGGPLACLKNGTYSLDGITSFGYGCGLPGSPGVYTRICKLINWIASVTAN